MSAEHQYRETPTRLRSFPSPHCAYCRRRVRPGSSPTRRGVSRRAALRSACKATTSCSRLPSGRRAVPCHASSTCGPRCASAMTTAPERPAPSTVTARPALSTLGTARLPQSRTRTSVPCSTPPSSSAGCGPYHYLVGSQIEKAGRSR